MKSRSLGSPASFRPNGCRTAGVAGCWPQRRRPGYQRCQQLDEVDDIPEGEPTPAEIKAACRRIRRGWSKEKRRDRIVQKCERVEVATTIERFEEAN